MLVGVDFDNTIVCYDRLFHALAAERGLIPADLPTTKTAVRDFLRAVGHEDDWTELQGIAYGPEILRAEPFSGALEFFRACKQRGIATAVISHKTQHPYRGEKHDLHAAARSFLQHHGFLDEPSTGLSDANVYLELTKEAKLARIAAAGCSHFIDDLPEFLSEPSFPADVERILFNPDRRTPDDSRWTSLTTWPQILSLFGSPRPGTPGRGAGGEGHSAEPNAGDVERLLSSANLPSINFQLAPVPGGGNNRGYRLTTSDGRSYFLKWYFRHPDDPRDRLGTEFAFTSFCRRHGIDEVPQPYARDDAAGLALYEFIEGRRLTAAEIDDAAVDAAVQFFRRVNEHRLDADANPLSIASEACFSVREHLDRIGGRVEQLVAAAQAPEADPAFRSFVHRKLAVGWETVRRRVGELYAADGQSTARVLMNDERRLSPSDFGFHNALKMPDGRLRFLDLEYAGWDDPAKTVCDFFCQVQVPVPTKFASRFYSAILREFVDRKTFDDRCVRLLPAYRLKWCCIALNVFLPTGSARRAFGAPHSAIDRRAEQLQKAIDIYNSIPPDPWFSLNVT